ncbi:MAG: hypothetical protein GX340_06455 [Clostridiales bacterium]|jgi:hypothetical protein|nr:hypothetical protein [Clostridiales bacterium]
MGPHQTTHRIVMFSDENMWDIFSDSQNNICYRSLKENMGWGNPHLITTNAKEEFGVCIDQDGKLHIICLSLEGRITYMHFDGDTWSEQVLGEYNIKEYDIRYPAILVLENKIHILFVFGNPWDTDIWTLYHYCWDGENWIHQRISDFTGDPEPTPYSYKVYDRDIHLSYRENSEGIYRVLHMKYHTDLQKWLRLSDEPIVEYKPLNSPMELNMYEYVLEWINKAQAVYREHITIAREADELRRRSMETKRRWELILEELEDFRIRIKKSQNKNPLKRIFQSILH